MLKYALLIGLTLPAFAFAADYNASGDFSRKGCRMDQSGNRYCIVPPIEKRITNCDPGVNCQHMESGAHYSVQAPVVPDAYLD